MSSLWGDFKVGAGYLASKVTGDDSYFVDTYATVAAVDVPGTYEQQAQDAKGLLHSGEADKLVKTGLVNVAKDTKDAAIAGVESVGEAVNKGITAVTGISVPVLIAGAAGVLLVLGTLYIFKDKIAQAVTK